MEGKVPSLDTEWIVNDVQDIEFRAKASRLIHGSADNGAAMARQSAYDEKPFDAVHDVCPFFVLMYQF